jgi:hypothetical protein
VVRASGGVGTRVLDGAIFDPAQPLLIPDSIVSIDEEASLAGYPIYVPQVTDGVVPEVWLADSMAGGSSNRQAGYAAQWILS